MTSASHKGRGPVGPIEGGPGLRLSVRAVYAAFETVSRHFTSS